MLCTRPNIAGGAFVACAVLAFVAMASVPNAISYQGVLLEANGQPSSAPTKLRFRILRGGDATTFPSTGIRVYHESVTVTPLDGVFSHLIGTGTAAADCAAGPCVLDATVFDSGEVPVWIEVMIDPDGIAGSADDDVLLPRTRVGTVGYAYHVASLDGSTGGDVSGDLSIAGTATVSSLTATTAITGPGVTSGVDPGHGHTAYQPVDPDLTDLADGILSGSKVEAASTSTPGTVTTGTQSFIGRKIFSGSLALLDETTLTSDKGFVQQAAPTFPGGQFGGTPGVGVKMRQFITEDLDAGSDAPGSVPGADTEFAWIGPYYNVSVLSPLARENPNDYSLGFHFTAGWTHVSGDRRAEYFWRHITSDGSTTWYPFAWNIARIHLNNPTLDYTIRTSPTQVGLHVNNTTVSIRGTPVGKGDLEVPGGSGTLYLGGSSGGKLKLEGPTNDSNQLEITAKNPTATRTQQFPDATGLIQVVPQGTPNTGTLLWGNSDDTTDTGDEVCASAGLICVDVRTPAGTDSDCTTDQGASGTYFYALCRS